MPRNRTLPLIVLLTLALMVGACMPAAPATAPTGASAPAATPTDAPTDAPATGGGMDPTAEPTTAPTPVPPLTLTSPLFAAGGRIPVRNACQGQDLSPDLAWSDPPAGTLSFVLVLDDPDAVPVAGYVWDHWVIFNLPATLRGLAEGIPAQAELSDGSRQGSNSFGRIGYDGPCPPSGQTHEYVFTLYAIDTLLDLNAGATKAQVLVAIEGHILDQSVLTGLYSVP